MAYEFGSAFQYVVTGSVNSGSEGSASLFPWDTVLTVPDYKNYVIDGIHATYNHSESYEENTGLNIAISESSGRYYLCKNHAILPGTNASISDQAIVLQSGQKLVAQTRGEHTVDLSVSYMQVPGNDIVRDSLALNIDFLDPDCYTDGATTCTNLGSISLTSTSIPAEWGIVDGHMQNTGNYSHIPKLYSTTIFQDNTTYECWFRPPDTGDVNYGIIGPTNFGGPSYNQGVWYQIYDTDGSSPVALYVRGGGLSPVISIPAVDELIHANVWNHLVLTYEGTTCKIYHQGELKVTGTVATPGNSASGLNIGGTYGFYPSGGDPAMWDITRVYHKVLTEGEILQNFNADKHRFSPLSP